MAGGYYTSWQHKFHDSETHTKESFAALCDTLFYRRAEYSSDIPTEEMIDCITGGALEKQRIFFDAFIEEKNFLECGEGFRKKLYSEYVDKTEALNDKFRSEYAKEIAEYKLFREWSKSFPSLKSFWAEFVEPSSSYITEIIPYEKWVEQKLINVSRCRVNREKEFKQAMEVRNNKLPRVKQYEKEKGEFLNENNLADGSGVTQTA